MLKAGQALSLVCPKMINFICVAHAFLSGGTSNKGQLPQSIFVDFINEKCICQVPKRNNMVKEMYPEIPLPPKPI